MPAKSVGAEISHLERDRGYDHDQAIAASLSMARRGDFGKKAQRKAKRSGRSRRRG